MRSAVLTFALAILPAAPAPAADPPCPAAPCPTANRPAATCPATTTPATTGMMTKVFPVMDLVVPIPDHTGPAPLPMTARVVREDGTSRTMTVTVMQQAVAPPPAAMPDRPHRVPPPAVMLVQAQDVPPGTAAPQPVMVMHAQPAAHAAHAARLCRMITTTCRPHTWRVNGGTGMVEFYEIGGSLVVCNSPAVLTEVEALLTSLRKEQACTVAVECRLVAASPGMVTLFNNPGMDGPGMTCLTDSQVRRFLTAVQADPQANVLQAPKVTLFNGQTGRVSCGDLVTKTFTTGMNIDQQGGQTVGVPRQVTEQFGTELKLQPTLSADRKYVRLAFVLSQRELAGPVELMPVTYTVRPVFEGGSQGAPIPFTQFLQQPSIVHRTVDRAVTLPDGGTVAVRVGTRMVETRTDVSPPVVSQLPYVGRYFRTVGISHEPREVVALLTTRVLTAGACEACPAAACPTAAACEGGKCCEQAKAAACEKACCEKAKAACCEKACCEKAKAACCEQACCESSKARELVAAYRKACAAGKTEEAMKLALQALALDPACFATTPAPRTINVEIRR